MTSHELRMIEGSMVRVCRSCKSPDIETCKDTTLDWCHTCGDWAGGELDRVEELNQHQYTSCAAQAIVDQSERRTKRGMIKDDLTGFVDEPTWRKLDEFDRGVPSHLE